MDHRSPHPTRRFRRNPSSLAAALLCALTLAAVRPCRSFRPSPPARHPSRSLRPASFFGRSDDSGGGGAELRSEVIAIEKHADFEDFLKFDDRLSIVKFYASWCKSCQKVGVKYRKLALDEGDRINSSGSVIRPGNVRFAEVEYSKNARLCKSLNVKKLPTMHMYMKGVGKVAEMTVRPSKFQDAVDEMHRLLSLSHEELEATAKTLLDGGMEEKKVVLDEAMAAKITQKRLLSPDMATFDEAMAAGSKLADELVARDAKTGDREKQKMTRFPFL